MSVAVTGYYSPFSNRLRTFYQYLLLSKFGRRKKQFISAVSKHGFLSVFNIKFEGFALVEVDVSNGSKKSSEIMFFIVAFCQKFKAFSLPFFQLHCHGALVLLAGERKLLAQA